MKLKKYFKNKDIKLKFQVENIININYIMNNFIIRNLNFKN